MKKIMLLILATVVLTACGTSEDDGVQENEAVQEDEEVNEEIPMDGDEIDYDALDYDEEDAVTDPMEAGDADNGVIFFQDDFGDFYYLKDGYVNEETDDKGFNYMEFDGFEVKYAVVLVEDAYNGDESIAFFVEAENNTDESIYYSMDMEILTDEPEKIEEDDMHTMGGIDPGVKAKGFFIAELDYESPETLEITFDAPYIDDEDLDTMYGEEIKVDFNKE